MANQCARVITDGSGVLRHDESVYGGGRDKREQGELAGRTDGSATLGRVIVACTIMSCGIARCYRIDRKSGTKEPESADLTSCSSMYERDNR